MYKTFKFCVKGNAEVFLNFVVFLRTIKQNNFRYMYNAHIHTDVNLICLIIIIFW